jgi:hypothetical protein
METLKIGSCTFRYHAEELRQSRTRLDKPKVGTVVRTALCMAVGLLMATSCARLPDFKKLEANMDAMVYHMGVMSSGMPLMAMSTMKMANLAERMEAKTDGMLKGLEKKGGSAERAIQNYSQALLDNERSMIKNLQGIKTELGDLKHLLAKTASSAAAAPEDSQVRAGLQNRLTDLEARLNSISGKIDQLDRKVTSPR